MYFDVSLLYLHLQLITILETITLKRNQNQNYLIKKYSCLKANNNYNWSLIITTKTQPKIEFKKVSLIVSAVKMLGYYCTTHNWNLFRFKVWFFNLTMTRALSSHAHAVRVTYANRNRRGQNQLAYTIS